MASLTLCEIEGCGKPIHTRRGWCLAHHRRWQRHGDPLGGGPRSPRHEASAFLKNVVLAYTGDECLLWPHATVNGYGVVGHKLVSRAVCLALLGPPPSPKHEAAHACGRGHLGCVAPAHLRWATSKENKADQILHGTRIRGSRHKMAKLSEEDVREIRKLASSMSQRAIANRYGVVQGLVWKILRGKGWAWLE